MQFYPLLHILFWIAVTLSPPGTSVITVKGPEKTWTWTRQESGWVHSAEKSIWAAQGTTVTSTSGDKTDKQDVTSFVKGIKGQDWAQSSSLNLGPMKSLKKEGDTFVYTLDAGAPSAKRFVIGFKKR